MHTPGPWRIATNANGDLSIAGDHRDETVLAVLFDADYRKNIQSNARLMVDAPDMLAALEQIRGFVAVMDETNWRDLRLHIERQCGIIEKATGK